MTYSYDNNLVTLGDPGLGKWFHKRWNWIKRNPGKTLGIVAITATAIVFPGAWGAVGKTVASGLGKAIGASTAVAGRLIAEVKSQHPNMDDATAAALIFSELQAGPGVEQLPDQWRWGANAEGIQDTVPPGTAIPSLKTTAGIGGVPTEYLLIGGLVLAGLILTK